MFVYTKYIFGNDVEKLHRVDLLFSFHFSEHIFYSLTAFPMYRLFIHWQLKCHFFTLHTQFNAGALENEL